MPRTCLTWLGMSRITETNPPSAPTSSVGRSVARRFVATFLGLTLLVGLLGAATLGTPQAAHREDQTLSDPIELVACIGYCSYPRNAGKVFRWGREKWRDEFEVGAFPRTWKSHKQRLLGMQHGMFTIRAPRSIRKIAAWREGHQAAYGRWEARLRAVELATAGQKYTFTWQLVPANADACTDNRIVLATYRTGDRAVRGMVQNAKTGKRFVFRKGLDLRSRAWHAFAIEVTRNHISWFVDTRVVRTERRPAALSGTQWRPEFVIEAASRGGNRSSWLQMDWVRHYTLARPNAKSIRAPRMRMTDFTPTCG